MVLQDRIENIIDRMESRIKQLKGNIENYKKHKDYDSAMKNDIKYRTMDMMSKELKKALSPCETSKPNQLKTKQQ